MSEEVQPLTPAQEEQLAELNYQNAMYNWQVDEDARLAELATLDPLIVAIGDTAAVEQLAADLEAALGALNESNAQHASRLIRMLRYDGLKLTQRYAQLSAPAPQPEMPAHMQGA